MFLWTINIPPRVRVFWCSLGGESNEGDFILRLERFRKCQFCSCNEDINHIFFSCPLTHLFHSLVSSIERRSCSKWWLDSIDLVKKISGLGKVWSCFVEYLESSEECTSQRGGSTDVKCPNKLIETNHIAWITSTWSQSLDLSPATPYLSTVLKLSQWALYRERKLSKEF
jgi:hypothetical protein